jgi:DNA-binding ferritin-like protein
MNLITNLLTIQNQFRVYHWQTQKKPGSFAQHEAFGKAYEQMDGLIDDFVETYMGFYGKSKPNTVFNISLQPLVSSEVVETVLNNFEEYLVSMNEEIPNNSDLLNIRDEMLGSVNKTKYLLTLK